MKAVARVVIGLAFAIAAIWAKAHAPDDYDHRYAPLVAYGHVGSPVTVGGFAVKVENVSAARSVTSAEGEIIRPDGVFVIVAASARSLRKPLSLSTAMLRTRDGREFRGSVKGVTIPIGGTLDGVTLGPGLWHHGVLVFEIPPSQLAGSTLLLSDRFPNENDPPSGFPPFGFELTAQANISLGLDDDRARRLVSGASEGITIRGERT
ncbi:MAG TPA: hypothetical protein VE198_09835 [Actinoallomurus sp.]|nr:hypothetical protein [Actinoallomurus sp.]